jgi:putative transposase
VTGRKRHVAVDTMGLLLTVVVHAANVADQTGAKLVVHRLLGQVGQLSLIWADGAYAGALETWVRQHFGWILQIVHKLPDQHTFQVLPRRWVVERTFGWLGRYRRLSKDYEALPESEEAWITIAMINLMLQRLYPRSRR